MALTGLEIPTFGGLNLRDDPTDVGFNGAIDMLNVDVRGSYIRQRSGYSKVNTNAAARPTKAVLPTARATRFVVVTSDGSSQVLVVWSYMGGTVATSATLASPDLNSNLVQFGTGTSSYVYGGTGTNFTQLVRWDGTSFAYPTVGYSARYVATTPWDNRLVLVNDNSDSSMVRFSDPGEPETFGANNFVRLLPNDGEDISGVCQYGNLLFVFKSTRFFVFYGTSVDAQGQPIFNYRTVDTGIGLAAHASNGGCAVQTDGVYFWARDGIYRTTGGAPVKVSQMVDPMFAVSSGWPYSPPTYGISPTMGTVGDRLFMSYSKGATREMLVRDISGTWMKWSAPAWAVAAATQPGSPTRAIFTSGNDIYLGLDPFAGIPTDAGAAIASRYRTGFGALAEGHIATMREMVLEGTPGNVGVSVSHDLATAVPTPTTVAISSATNRGRFRKAVRGRTLSVSFSGVAGADWEVGRAQLLMRNNRYVGADPE